MGWFVLLGEIPDYTAKDMLHSAMPLLQWVEAALPPIKKRSLHDAGCASCAARGQGDQPEIGLLIAMMK
jgi:hypothetical protein